MSSHEKIHEREDTIGWYDTEMHGHPYKRFYLAPGIFGSVLDGRHIWPRSDPRHAAGAPYIGMIYGKSLRDEDGKQRQFETQEDAMAAVQTRLTCILILALRRSVDELGLELELNAKVKGT